MLGMICVDVDGTLIGQGNRVRDDVWAALEGARAQGVRLVLCSGRPAFGNALDYARRLDPDGWHVFQNGASIVRADTGESLSTPLPAGVLPELLARARSGGELLEVYTDRTYGFTEADPHGYGPAHAALLGVPYAPRAPEELDGAVVRVQWVVPMAQEQAVLDTPHPGLDLHPSSSPPMPGVSFVSATTAGTSKGSAVTRVAQAYGVDLDRVMMVGDAANDVTALRVVGHPVAMGNADEVAREAARYQVGHVDAGGLAEAVALALKL